ncbi:MAG: hypothetical protein AMXMBFR47_07840 [Planctomycetota bacterium]
MAAPSRSLRGDRETLDPPMHTTPPSLLMRVRDSSDRAAWDDFDRRYREWLIRFFRRRQVPYPDAEDLVQRVFANLVITLPQFTYDPNRGRFRDYLFRCAKNALTEWATRPGRNGKALTNYGPLNSAVGGEPDPAEALEWEREWMSHHYRMALEALRTMATDRDIAILERSMNGVPVSEMAREFEMDEAAVYKVRHRIRERLEVLIAGQIEEEDRTDA